MAVNPVIATAEEIKTALSRAQIASTSPESFDEYADSDDDEDQEELEQDQTLVMHQGCV